MAAELLPAAASENHVLSILQKCRQKKDLHRTRWLHAYMQQHHLDTHEVFGNHLVPLLVDCGSLSAAQLVFDKLPARSEHSWSSLISGYVDLGEPQKAFQLYWKMQEDHVYPSTYTFSALLRACTRLKDPVRGQIIHVEIIKRGLENNQFICNTMVDMYGKCALHAEARQAFNSLSVATPVSWNALIAGYAEHGLGEEALSCFEEMQDKGVAPNDVTFICSLKACASTRAVGRCNASGHTYVPITTLKAVEIGCRVHSEIIKRGFERDLTIGNTLLDMYTKFRLLVETQIVFDQLPNRNFVSWTVLIGAYANHGLGEEALIHFKQMLMYGIPPDDVTLICSLKACGTIGSVEKCHEIHMEIIARGLEKKVIVGNTLVDMYAKSGLLTEAQELFDRLLVRDVVSWTAIITGYEENGHSSKALLCFKQMQDEGVIPDADHFVSNFRACGRTRDVERGRVIHTDVIKMGLEKDPFVGTTLLDMYARCGSLTEARYSFDNIQARTVVSWTALIAGYIEIGPFDEVWSNFEQMQAEGISPDASTWACTLKACGMVGALDRGQDVHSEIVKKGLEEDVFLGNSLVDMYAKCGALAEARGQLDQISVQNIVPWTSLIAGYAENGFSDKVLSCAKCMESKGVTPDADVFICSLKACGVTGNVERGQEIYAEIVKRGLERELYVGATLVDMYAKCESVAAAQELFAQLPDRNIVSWTALLVGYAENGYGDEVLNCFKEMQLEGVSPDANMFVCSLKACGITGALIAGQQIHSEITKRAMESESCMGNILVDMYAHCGYLIDALNVFENLSVRDAVSWNALVMGYSEHGHCDKALNCFKQMQLSGMSPGAITFIGCLKACGTKEDSESGQEFHSEIIKTGFEKEVYVGNTLVDMYAKCHLLLEAQNVFDRLAFRDIVSWTALMTGYAENSLGNEVLKSFEQMQLEGLSPDADLFVCKVKACGILKALDTGQETGAELTKKGLEREMHVGRAFVEMYAKCGSLAEASQMFHQLPVHETAIWNALIAKHPECGFGEVILENFLQMQMEGVSPDAVTCVCSLKACSIMGTLETGRQIHDYTIKKGLDKDLHMGNTLTDFYGRCGSATEARNIFDKLAVQDVISWNAMIKSYGECHEGIMAIQCFEDMQKYGVKPDAVTFTCLLVACSHASFVLEGQQYFKVMIEVYGIEPTVDHYTCMVDLLARSGNISDAEQFIEAMQCLPSKEILRALLSACKVYGKVDLGLQCFQQLVEVNQENGAAYLLMADIYATAGKWNAANRIQEIRVHAGAPKKLACASIEVNKRLHNFVVSDTQSKHMPSALSTSNSRLKEKGYVPCLDLALRLSHGEEMVW